MFTNKINGKRYVGQTINFDKRYREHKRNINSNLNYPIYKAFRKYGIDNFEVEILIDDVVSKELLNDFEKFFISHFGTLVPNGYNVALGGDGGNTFVGKTSEEMEAFGKKMSEIWANKSQEEKDIWHEKTHKSGEEHWNYGLNHSEDTKSKISETLKAKYASGEIVNPLKGKKMSDEFCANISRILKEKYANGYVHPCKGRIMPQETRDKISKAKKGKGKIPLVGYNMETKKYRFYFTSEETRPYGFDPSCVLTCAKGNRRQHKGYKWFYVDDFYEFIMGGDENATEKAERNHTGS